MRCWAISDLHLGYEANRNALETMAYYPDDWLILAGDIGERLSQLEACIQELRPRFSKLIWVPGNHELYTLTNDPCQARGEKRYQELVALCRSYDVLTPEDPYVLWPGDGPPTVIVPVFLLYDYSFGPDGYSREEAIAWAREHRLIATDERFLHSEPYDSKEDWCRHRIAVTRKRLDTEIPKDHQIVLINHYPLRRDLVRLFKIPRYTIWCGTRETENWHQHYPISTVVSGHLHMRATDWRDGVRFEEVALGYPRHWRPEKSIDDYLRLILPHPPTPSPLPTWPIWHR